MNTQPNPPLVTYHVVLLAFAIVFAAVFTAMAFDWVTYEHPFGFLGLAVTFGLASRLP